MFNTLKNPPAFEITIPCDCGTEKICINTYDDMEDYYCLSFYIDSFYACQSVWYVIKDRIKLAWKALRKGNFIFQEMILTSASIKELRDDLNTLLEKEKHEVV